MSVKNDSDSDQEYHVYDPNYAKISEDLEKNFGSIKDIEKQMASKHSQIKILSEHFHSNCGKDGELDEFKELKNKLKRDSNLKNNQGNYLEDGEIVQIERVMNDNCENSNGNKRQDEITDTEKFNQRKSILEKGGKAMAELRRTTIDAPQNDSQEISQPQIDNSPPKSGKTIIFNQNLFLKQLR